MVFQILDKFYTVSVHHHAVKNTTLLFSTRLCFEQPTKPIHILREWMISAALTTTPLGINLLRKLFNTSKPTYTISTVVLAPYPPYTCYLVRSLAAYHYTMPNFKAYGPYERQTCAMRWLGCSMFFPRLSSNTSGMDLCSTCYTRAPAICKFTSLVLA
jgi:hypothetical protein